MSSLSHISHRLRGRLAPFVFSLLFVLLSAAPAQALRIGCRSDPIILLSNGVVIDMSADIGTALWKVDEVTYTLHAPEGVSVVATISTPSWPTTIERFHFYADNPPGQYTGTTVVKTRDTNIPVTAHMLFGLQLRSRSGYDRQELTIEFVR
jgi:hypothetical protein